VNAPPGRKRTAARLAAVQALYQIELTQAEPRLVIEEFLAHRFGESAKGEDFGAADQEFFGAVAGGAAAHQAELDRAIAAALTPDWPLNRLESVLRAILRCGAFELAHRPDVAPEIVINEYLDITHAFFGEKEPGLVNGVLDSLARRLRAGELGEKRHGAEPASR
jgi:transcription antitermination protein NusB